MSALKLQDDSGDPVLPRDGVYALRDKRKQGRQNTDLLKATPAAHVDASLISRREWFLTNAPPVPDWFRYKAEGMPKKEEQALPDPEKELPLHQQNELRAWQASDSIDFASLSPGVRAFMRRWQQVNDANEAFYEWRMKSREAKYWAWRETFADKMMEENDGK